MDNDFSDYQYSMSGFIAYRQWLRSIEEAFERGEKVDKTKYNKIEALLLKTKKKAEIIAEEDYVKANSKRFSKKY